MPFGMGPRNCIAFRMGLLVSKMAIAMILRHYDVFMVSKKELEFDYGGVGLLPSPGHCKIKLAKKQV